MKKNDCYQCNGTGNRKRAQDEEEFNRVFDKLDQTGFYSTPICLEKAFDAAGYEMERCSYCDGTGKKVK